MSRFGICNETFGDWPLEKALQTAADLGYTGWEVAPFMLDTDVRRISAPQRLAYRRSVEAAGLEVIGLHWLLAKTTGFHLTTNDDDVRKRTAEYFRELIRLCADLGGEVMVLGSPQQRNREPGVSIETANSNAAEILNSLAACLAENDVRIALEPLGPEEGNFLNTADQARELRDQLSNDHVGLHLDVKAMSTESTPIPEIILRHSDWLLHFHANDPNRRGPGMGEVRFPEILRSLDEIGYHGWISVEVFDYSLGPETLAAESIATLSRGY